jgi:hypothetical protein
MARNLREEARAALAKPRFRQLLALVPAAERNDARSLLRWLSAAAEFDRSGAESDEYNEAYTSLHRLAAAQDVYDKAVRLYHDPKIRAAYGDDKVNAAWDNPAVAKELLLKESAAGRLPSEADAALATIYEIEEMGREAGVELPAPTATPLPSSADGVQREIDELLAKVAKGRLTEDEDKRLTSLYEQRYPENEAETAAEAASGRKTPAGGV